MRRSATGTCSSREHLLSVIPISASSPRGGSNCPSTSTISNMNPRFTCVLCASLMCFRTVSVLPFLSQATVPNFIARLIETRNGILLTFITLTHSMTFRQCAMIDAGIGASPPHRTMFEAVLTVFPFDDPTSGPNMSSAFTMSWPVTSQFKMRSSFANSTCRLELGLPILTCVVRAFSAR
jgi:hypothetical protein